MSIVLDHTIVQARDPAETAAFWTEIIGMDPAEELGHFTVMRAGPTSIDLVRSDEAIASRHFAFRVSEDDFDKVFRRIRDKDIPYWADPGRTRPNEINHWDDGRGLYFKDPNGHLLEVLTRSYGSGGKKAEHPNPLLGA